MRIKVELSQHDIDISKKIGDQRHNKKHTWQSTAKPRKNADKTHEHGLQGELAVSKLFEFNVDLEYKTHGDKGYDFIYAGKTFDIKTINNDPPILKFKSFDNIIADYYIVVLRCSDSELYICGMTDRKNFIKNYYFLEKGFGYGSRLCLDEKKLLPIIPFIKEQRKKQMNQEECKNIIYQHKSRVQSHLYGCIKNLLKRGELHDESKLDSPELELFAEYTPMLKKMTFGTKEYQESLKALAPALKHHFENNSHHPEHYKNGVSGMSLLDLLEMLMDWKAASEYGKNGDIYNSIKICAKKFDIDAQLTSILYNTANELFK